VSGISIEIEVLAFDVFGTVVDWHGSICRDVKKLGLAVDAADFARSWREGYQPAMQRVRSGELGWTKIDTLHRMILDQVIDDYNLQLDEARRVQLNAVWHRLDPWPDVVEGLQKLKSTYSICTLSNGNLALLANMAKYAALPWDLILSAEVFKAYKPDRESYLGVAEVYGVPPEKVMLVAAHQSDLDAARQFGLRTAYIERPFEYGVDQVKDVTADESNDFHARDFADLADQLIY